MGVNCITTDLNQFYSRETSSLILIQTLFGHKNNTKIFRMFVTVAEVATDT